ncbi:MAG TPA: hypothetical protein VMV92_19930 [Streptosporangiaceae bacterium]|nr:hypothetical protein [Streptosporangiaceae bacterium]
MTLVSLERHQSSIPLQKMELGEADQPHDDDEDNRHRTRGTDVELGEAGIHDRHHHRHRARPRAALGHDVELVERQE